MQIPVGLVPVSNGSPAPPPDPVHPKYISGLMHIDEGLVNVSPVDEVTEHDAINAA